MAKKFLGFTPDQQFTLLSKMGYSGPKDKASMDQFMEANPAAAAKMGSYTQKALEKLNPQPQFATGGAVVQKKTTTTTPTTATPTTPAPTPEQLALQAQQKELLMEQRKDVIDSFKNPSNLVTQAQPAQIQEQAIVTGKQIGRAHV